MRNLKYRGTMGATAHTPQGVVKKGEVIAPRSEDLGERMFATGHFEWTDEAETHPTEPSPFTGSTVAAQAAAQAAAAAPAASQVRPAPAAPQAPASTVPGTPTK